MMVKLFSLPGCNTCWQTEKRLTRNHTEYEKIMLDEDESARQSLIDRGILQPGSTQAPIVIVERDGEVVDSWQGFLVTRIDALKEQS
jgi:glutaredoxin